MEKQFVTYEIALKLKELGFDEECFGRFDICDTEELQEIYEIEYFLTTINNYFNSGCKYIKVPIWQQVIDWFIDKYDIHISLEPVYKPQQFQNLMYCYAISTKENFYGGIDDNLDNWIGLNDGGNMFHIENSRYKAREQAILKAIELCQNKKF